MTNNMQTYTLIIPVWITDQDGHTAYPESNKGFLTPNRLSIKVEATTPDQALDILQQKLDAYRIG